MGLIIGYVSKAKSFSPQGDLTLANVKISDFVASTARYAKKAALAADKTNDGKLSKADAKYLPKDLQDDYARQAKLKSTITPAGFARDQAAYVAAAAKKADTNKDGILSATEAKALPVSVKNNYKNFAANLGTGPTPTASGFVGSGAGKNQTLDGKPFVNLPLSEGVKQLVEQLKADSDNSMAYAAAFKGKPADLSAALASPETHKQFFNDLLFRATGTTYDKDYPQYYVADQVNISPFTAAQALSDLTSDFSGNATATSAQVPADTAALMDLMKAPGTKYFKLNWNNGDDASFDATVAINPTNGEIKVVGTFNEP